MKKLFSIVALLLVLPFTSVVYAKTCVQPIFSAKTADKVIQVDICVLDNGNVYYQQTTGEDRKVTESFENTKTQTSFVDHHAGGIVLKEFNVASGDISYNVTDGVNDEGVHYANITFMSNTEKCQDTNCYSTVEFDINTVKHWINGGLSNIGIPESDEL